MAKTDTARRLSLKPFAVGYLVWHCLTSLVTICLLGCVSLQFFAYVGWEGLTIPVLGLPVSVLLLLIAGWVFSILVAVSGVLFALGSIGRWEAPENTVSTLGRSMLAICALELVLGVIQGNFFTLLSKAISILLTGAILHELKEAGETAEESDGDLSANSEQSETNPRDATVSNTADCSTQAAHTASSKTAGYASVRHLARMCEGYSLIMFFWGALRLLTGIAEIFNGGFSASDEGSVHRVISGAVLVGVGIYLIAVGRYGKASTADRSRLKTFRTLSIVGLCASVGSVIPTVVWATAGSELSTGDLFCSTVDLALYAAGVFYAHKLSQENGGAEGQIKDF